MNSDYGTGIIFLWVNTYIFFGFVANLEHHISSET